MFLIDSHCHLDALNYYTLHKNLDDVLNKSLKNDVNLILSVCNKLSSFDNIKTMVDNKKEILLSCGIHPINIYDEIYDRNKFYSLSMMNNVIAIGETGLDYHYRCDNKEEQKRFFREHIYISIKNNKPIIIHTRNATKDTIDILKEDSSKGIRGVVHCFTENIDIARIFLNMGFYISFSGIITFKNAFSLHEVIRYVPIDRIILETDSPYLTPVPYRGKENQPAYLRNIAEFFSVIRGIQLEKCANITTNNFLNLFNIKNLII